MHLADAWESIADALPEATALIQGNAARTWMEYEARAARFAGFSSDLGLGPGCKVGVYLLNCSEYLEAQFGAMKLRGTAVNVNFRYTAEELVYLLDNADAEVLLYDARFRSEVDRIRSELPRIAAFVEVSAGTVRGAPPAWAVAYERTLETPPMARIPRRDDNLYMLYTGGTTGLPKGVMYDAGLLCEAFLGPYEMAGLPRPEGPEALHALVSRLHAAGGSPVALPGCPLMHGTGMWIGAMIPHLMGGAVATLPVMGLDPAALLQETVRVRATNLVIVGDAFARPLLAELERAAAAGTPYDLSALQRIASSGAMWSREVKEGLLRHADVTLVDSMGATEGGMGRAETTRASVGETARFELGEGTRVFDDHDRAVEPGSGKIGRIAQSAMVPRGYYKDPEKTAATFREIDGVRYSFPGDFATVEANGTVRLLGRGSNCINTGGEKVYPEEVEETLKRHSAILDCLVVGLPDERFGQRVAAVAAVGDAPAPSPSQVLATAREHLAGYKLPKTLLFVPEVVRTASGKPDYRWARAALDGALSRTDSRPAVDPGGE